MEVFGWANSSGLVIPLVRLSSELIQFPCSTIWPFHLKRDTLLSVYLACVYRANIFQENLNDIQYHLCGVLILLLAFF